MSLRDLISRRPGSRDLTPAGGGYKDPFGALQTEVEKAFDSLFRHHGHGLALDLFGANRLTFTPSVDVTETEKDITVTAELPGLKEKDIKVSLNKNTLTLKGEKKEEKEEKTKGYYRAERTYGSFTRTVVLPGEVDAEKVDATYKKGVLTITLAKTETETKKTKKIPVKG